MSVLSTSVALPTATALPVQRAEPALPAPQARQKVLWLAHYPHPGIGLGTPNPWVASLAAALQQQPEVELTVLNWQPRLQKPIEEFDQNGIHFIYLRAPSFRQDILTLYAQRIHIARKYLRLHHQAYDVLHLHGSEWQLPAVVPGLERPVVLSVQGLVSECVKYLPRRWTQQRISWELAGFYERKYLPAIHEFICRTPWDKAHIARLSPGARIHHNWEMLRPAFYEPASQIATSAGTRPQILFAGGTQQMKGFREALQAYALIRRQSNLKLVIAGSATLEIVNNTARQLSLPAFAAGDVECVGFCDAARLAQLMRQSFCLLHPSYIDNSPNTVCEAQMVGLPVVASDVGGIRGLIEPGQTGLLSDLRPGTLAAQVLALYQNPELAATLSRESKRKAVERHDPETIVRRTLAIYQTIS